MSNNAKPAINPKVVESMNAKTPNPQIIARKDDVRSKERKAFFRCLTTYRANKEPEESIRTLLASHPGKPEGYDFGAEESIEFSPQILANDGNGGGNDEEENAPGPPVKKSRKKKAETEE